MYAKLTASIHQFWALVITFHFYFLLPFQFSLVQSLSLVRLFVTLSVATKYRNHYKGRDLWLILGNSAPLLLKIFLLLLPLSPPLMFHYVYPIPFVTGPTTLEYWAPFSSFYFSHCTSACEASTDTSWGSPILSLSVCWSSVSWWVKVIWYNVFDFQHFLLILRVSIFLLILPICSYMLSIIFH